MKLYEILVPTVRNNGKPFHLKHHRVWDEKVLAIAGGLTIIFPQKGKWVSNDKKLFAERMIPVRIACTQEQIQIISDLTAKHYEQLAIFFYKVSDEVEVVNYDPERKYRRKRITIEQNGMFLASKLN